MVELLLILAAAAAAAAALAGLGYLLVWFLLHGRRMVLAGKSWRAFGTPTGASTAPACRRTPGGLPPGGGGRIRRRTGCPSDPGWPPGGDPRRGFGADVRRSRPGGGKKPRRSLPLSGWQAQRNTSLFWRRCSPLFAGRAPLVVELKTDRHGAGAGPGYGGLPGPLLHRLLCGEL